MMQTPHISIQMHDITEEQLKRARAAGQVAWDIETSGLDWRTERIGTCQLAFQNEAIVLQLLVAEIPANLAELLADSRVQKVFHHAPFDLRFMSHHWGVSPVNIACTKIASKIVNPHLEHESHSLKEALIRHLNISLDKGARLSDWSRLDLTPDQIDYAIGDVLHLTNLLRDLEDRAESQGVSHLLRESFGYIPARVALDLMGVGDVFQY